MRMLSKIFSVVLLCGVLFCTSVYATDLVRYVNTNCAAGGDGTADTCTGGTRSYSSISEFESSEQQDLTDGGGDTMTVYCAPDGGDDTTAVTFTGWTTDIDNFVTITAKVEDRHLGIPGDGYTLTNTTNGTQVFNTNQAYLVVEWIDLYQASTGSSDEAFRVALLNTVTTIKNCIIRAANAGTNDQDGIYTGNYNVPAIIVNNCLIFGWARAGIHAQNYTATTNTQTWYINNCTIFLNGEDGETEAGGICSREASYAVNNMNVINTIITDTTENQANSGDYADFLNNSTWSIDNCMDEDNTIASRDAGGSNNVASATAYDRATIPGGDATMVIYEETAFATIDLHLVSNDSGGEWNDAIDAGQDPGDVAAKIDIDGSDRHALGVTWDMGADEFIAAAAGTRRMFVTQ